MLYVVIGPPAAGKSTWCRDHAQPGDVVIDYDAIAVALNPHPRHSHKHPPAVQSVTRAARHAAIERATTLTDCDVYIIHSSPSPARLAEYERHGATIITVDPGQDVVLDRAKAERPWWMQAAVRKWYDNPPATAPRPKQPTGTTKQRGYGNDHKRLREALRPEVEAGKAYCWRCVAQGVPADEAKIKPGQPWDLGHDDDDRSRYRGPEHRRCNRATRGRRKDSGPVDRSRDW